MADLEEEKAFEKLLAAEAAEVATAGDDADKKGKGRRKTPQERVSMVDGQLASPSAVSGEPPAPVAKPEQDVQQPPVFVVGRNVTVAWQGRIIKLRAGAEVSDSSYGPGAMDRFRNAGVQLNPK